MRKPTCQSWRKHHQIWQRWKKFCLPFSWSTSRIEAGLLQASKSCGSHDVWALCNPHLIVVLLKMLHSINIQMLGFHFISDRFILNAFYNVNFQKVFENLIVSLLRLVGKKTNHISLCRTFNSLSNEPIFKCVRCLDENYEVVERTLCRTPKTRPTSRRCFFAFLFSKIGKKYFPTVFFHYNAD